MPKRHSPIAITLVAMLLAPSPAFSWGNEGHHLVGAIADKVLTQNPNDPTDKKVLAQLHAVFGPSFQLRDIATCADRIRDFVREAEKAQQTKGKGKGKTQTPTLDAACAPLIAKFSTPENLPAAFPHSDKWHFIDTPLGTAHSLADIKSFCGPNLCAPDRIEHYREQLTAVAKVSEKAESILFLTHLVGDLHQPLHSAERKNDVGGNELFVTVFGQSFQLHHVW